MAAPLGNEFWKLRSQHGRDKLFKTPELLWEAACEYFEWCLNHPWTQSETIVSDDKGVTAKDKPTARPFTLTAFAFYVNASVEWWRGFKKEDHKDFLGVIADIESVIYTQKFEGAAVGAYNANIIARDLGLVDKKSHEGADGEPLFNTIKVEIVKPKKGGAKPKGK